MGSRNISFLVFSFIALLVFLHFPSQSEATDQTKLLQKVCKANSGHANHEICMKTLIAIAEKHLSKARRESIRTSNFFTGLANKKDTNPAVKPALESCASFFKDTLVSLVLEVEGKSSVTETVSLRVHYALDAADSCKTALSDSHVNIKSIAERLKKWNAIFSIANAAVEALDQASHTN